jgi:site-specific DNA recombinase
MTHVAELQDRLKKLIIDNKTNKEAAVVKLLSLSVQPKLTYGYVRVSLQRQVEEGHSIEAQSQKIKEYCVLHNLLEPVIMADHGISGKSTDNRDAFNQMVSLVKSGDTIVSYSLSRLGRSTLDILNLVKNLKEKGVALFCLDKQIDLNTTEGNMFLSILASVNEFEREQAAARTSMVMQNMSKMGKLRTRGPFGYRAEDNKLIPVPEEQKVIEYIALFLSMNPTATDAMVTKAVQEKVDLGELVMRKTKERNPDAPNQLKRPCEGKKVYQSTIANIIKNNKLRDVIKDT